MSLQDCIQFANDHNISVMATLDKDQPRARTVGMWYADNTGFYFQCGTYKPFYQQLKKHRKVEVCFFNQAAAENLTQDKNGEPLTVLRVAGDIEFMEDPALRMKCIEETPIMAKIGIKGPEDKRFAVFRICHGEAYFWQRKDTQKENELEKFKF